MLRRSRARAVAAVLATTLAAAGVASLTGAQAATADTQAPTLTSYRLLPGAVDVTAGAKVVTAVVRVGDGAQAGANPAGFSNGTVTLTGPITLPAVGFSDRDRVSGSPFDGTYDVHITVPQGAPAGSYTGSVYLEDFAHANVTVAAPAALTVADTPDTTAPAVQTLTASATDVDVTAGDRPVTYTARVTDAQSGTKSVRVTLAGPNGAADVVDLDRTAGTANDGTWTGVEHFSTWAPPGAWAVGGVTTTDNAGNAATTTAGLGAATVTVHVTVDSTKPTFTSIALDQTSVDVSDGTKTVHVTVRAGDDASGVAFGHLTFTGSDGYSVAEADLSANPVTGTTTNGTWTADVPFDTPGTYTLSTVDLADAQGNELILCTPATSPDPYDPAPASSCDGPQPAATVTVTSSADTVPPTVSGFTIGPATATTAYQGAARVDGAFTVADATSGYASATVTLADTHGNTRPIYLSRNDLVAGTVHSGTVGFSTYFDVSDAGTWTVQQLEVDDWAGNATILTTGLGSVTVVTTAGDTTAPTLTAIAVTPNPVTTTGGAQPVTVTARLTDAQAGAVASGVADATVTLTSPAGATVPVDLDTLVAGDDVTGTWTGTATIGQYADAGSWTVGSASVVDVAGLRRTYPAGSAVLAGGAFTVVSATDTTSPVVTSVTVPGTVDGTAAGRAGVTVPVHVRGTDAGSGIDDVGVTLTGPGGVQATALTPVATTAAVDTDVLVPLPAFNGAGTWTVTGVDLLSDHGVDAHWTSLDLTLHLISATFLLSEPSDTTGPAVAGLTVTPTTISTAAAPVDADVLVHLTDAGSGVAQGWVTLTSPHGYQTLSTGLTLVAGDAGDGWWQGSVRLPGYVDPGAWRISVSAKDAVGNGTDASGSALNGASTVTVSGKADTTAPVLTGLTPSRGALDATALSSGGWLTIATTATDGESGVAGIDVTVTAPNGTSQVLPGSPVAASTPAAASYVSAVPLASLLQLGTWTISAVTVRDLAGNAATYTGTQLAAWPTAFSVLSLPGVTPVTTQPPPVPTNVTAILAGTTTAVVSWAAPSATVTGYTVTPYQDGTQQATVATSTPSATFTNLARGSSYTFVVRAVNSAGTSAGSVPSVQLTVPAVAPSAPAITSVSVVGTTATVTLGAPADNGGAAVTSYAVTPWTSGTPGTAVTVAASTGTATVTGLQRGLSYAFTAEAANNKGWSAASAAYGPTLVPVIAPSAPTGVTATVTGTTATVSWAAPADTGGAPVTGYTVTPSAGTPVTVGASATSASVPGLPAGTTVTLAVTATNTAGTGPAATASVAVAPAVVPPPPPPAPVRTALTITALPSTLVYGAALPVTGRLVRADTGAPLAGRAVQLQYRRHGVGGYVTLPGTGRTSATGVVTFTSWRPAYSVDVRLVFGGESGFVAATSAVRTAGEYAKFAIAGTATVRKGSTFLVLGSVGPNKRGHVIWLQVKVGTRWVNVSHQTLSATSGFRFTLRATTKGTAAYRVSYAADGYQVASTSTAVGVRTV